MKGTIILLDIFENWMVNSSIPTSKQQDFNILGRQDLTVLRSHLHCSGGCTGSDFFYFDGVFYIDTLKSEAIILQTKELISSIHQHMTGIYTTIIYCDHSCILLNRNDNFLNTISSWHQTNAYVQYGWPKSTYFRI